jgi:putative DNA primase/helicase
MVNLDPQTERPELREFKYNPVKAILEDRGKYVAAVLTICRAYVAAGRPNRASRLASFEGWSDTVRSALIWLGKADPVDSMELARAEDPELSALRDVLMAWGGTIGVGYSFRCTMQELIQRSSETTAPTDALRWPELHAAVQAAAGRYGPADARGLGNWARNRKDRIIGGLKLTYKPSAKGGSEWGRSGGWSTRTGKKRPAPTLLQQRAQIPGAPPRRPRTWPREPWP